jgi:predicted GIY-YIG superfamily endonuclease
MAGGTIGIVNKEDQKALALWAVACAAHALKLFEQAYPDDMRPRQAIKAARDWAKGKIKVGEARRAALAAHAAARMAQDDPAAQAAARAAGHAAATAHVARHAAGVRYAVKAAELAGKKGELAWQKKRLPKHLYAIGFHMAAWHVYILQCKDGSLYTGIATDVSRRFGEHAAKKGARYTRSREPERIAYAERASSHSAALKREAQIKKLTRAQKLALIRASS